MARQPDKPILVIAGSSGPVGRHLIAEAADTYHIRVLTRRPAANDHPDNVEPIGWNPAQSDASDPLRKVLEGAAAVVNLAGASLGDGRLNDLHKERILNSRVDATRALRKAWEAAAAPPPVWFQASAVGIYGDTGETEITASHPPAEDDFFLAHVCKAWEAEALKVQQHDAGPRMIIGRIGLVFSKDAEAWQKLLLPIRLGVGGRLGSGKQWWPWIEAGDLARAIRFLVETEEMEGAFNLTAPNPRRQIEIVQATAKHLGRPAFLPAPKFALKLVLGEAADALILPSCKAVPKRLIGAGFEFHHPTLESALPHLT